MPPVRILHVGWGFSPWRPGGLIYYAEDLMAAQAARGHEVAYLFSGRHYPGLGGPRLRRWRRPGVAMLEIVNAPIVVGLERGTRTPERDLEEPRLERIFARVLRQERPDVVHVQELLGHPSSILELAADAGVPTVMTLQDYFPLCATVRLIDVDGRVCLRRAVGEDCALRNAAAPADARALARHSLHFDLARAKQRIPGLRRVDFAPLRPLVDPIVAAAARRPSGAGAASGARAAASPPLGPEAAREFQRRRDVNVARLGRVDRLVAQSTRVEEIYRLLGVDGTRMRTLHLTLGHLERIAPRPPRTPRQLTLATLGGFLSPSKGSELLLETLERLRSRVAPGSFRLLAFGVVDEAAEDRVRALPEVELRGSYERDELDRALDEVDVGIMPSVWEEAYGFAGLEFLAKGVPVVANRIGGMVDYVRAGETGWLNDSCSAEGLASILGRLIGSPGHVEAMSRNVLALRDSLIKPLDRHADEMDEVYAEAIAGASLPAP
jgi:glycosyltransferase involved in cell wall biosynthesis